MMLKRSIPSLALPLLTFTTTTSSSRIRRRRIIIRYDYIVCCKMSSTPTPTATPTTPRFPKFISLQNTYSSTSIPLRLAAAAADDDDDDDIKRETARDRLRFRLVSYNILAQVYVKSSLFPHSPSSCLRWKARSQALLTLLNNLGADFLCLQEVDEYESFYKPNMDTNGYSSIYLQRSGNKRDGCAIFFKPNSAELILQENIDYNDLLNSIQNGTLLSDDIQNDEQATVNKDATVKSGSTPKDTPQERGDPNDPCVRLKRDCVGIMAAFKLKGSFNHIVIVANTHLYWDPEWADVKLAQAKYLLSRLAQFKTLVTNKFKCASSLIAAGDFNSTPGDKVYQYLISGTTSSPLETIRGLEDVPIPLRSVYDFTVGEPKFTNCTPDFTNTLDYIFFSTSDCIKPVSLLELPESDSSDVAGGLPNSSHPSDHIPIGAEFEISSSV
ncbi:Endonuclease/exonuclease/phosphatase [Parasponia andersonii]|uniref:Endonuclease/exonuclease/phosphatase n=1 Tax=Parasponia andersonii TaxID=3476 RepID=A0A2P5AKX7_PARAD|nr:Endonuclease/exonuclease/phosphatase [Parasponia andersonii]